jgi:hypothetical protein
MKARENPFRSDCVEGIAYRFQGTTCEEVMIRLAALSCRCAVVGPHGSGKTTLLEEIGDLLAASGCCIKRLVLTHESPAFPAGFLKYFYEGLAARDVLLFDGADLMAHRDWLKFRRTAASCAGLVITSHRPGLLPTLLECHTTPELLEEVVRELVGNEAASLPLQQLYEKHLGNLRDVLRELYELYALK